MTSLRPLLSFQGEQSDSGMVLPSEELRHLMLDDGAEDAKLSRWPARHTHHPSSLSLAVSVTTPGLCFRFFPSAVCREQRALGDVPGHHGNKPSTPQCDWESEQGSPPPDYNSAFLYPSL